MAIKAYVSVHIEICSVVYAYTYYKAGLVYIAYQLRLGIIEALIIIVISAYLTFLFLLQTKSRFSLKVLL